MEDIDENRSNFTDVMTNHNGNSNNSHDEKVIEKKKKKEKSGEKSKKKKHKKKECEKNSRSTKSNEENTPSNDIDLWLEDVSNQPVAKDTIDDGENDLPSKSKKEKKKKKKHSKDKKRDRSHDDEQTKTPKTQCLVDANGVKLNCFLQAQNNSDDHNVKVTFTCENIQSEVAFNDVEITLEAGQKITAVDPNPIKTSLPPKTSQTKHSFLKVLIK